VSASLLRSSLGQFRCIESPLRLLLRGPLSCLVGRYLRILLNPTVWVAGIIGHFSSCPVGG
jgi:hypothetical protein